MVDDRVEAMLAERACERLLYEYAQYVDRGEAARIAGLFTEHGQWVGADGGGMLDRNAIRAGFERRQALSRRQSRHVITNVLIDVRSPDEAEGVAYLINYRHDSPSGQAEHPAPAGHPKFVGDYHLRFRRVDGEWLIASLQFDILFLRQAGHAGT
jgi:hypothetical protein